MRRPTSRSRATRRRVARAALAVVIGALALSGCDFSVYSLPLPGGADLGDHPYTVKVEFRDVLDLVPQSSVKVDDVTVGRVEDIEVEGYHAQVTLKLRDSVKLPDNAVARIRQTSLLGEKFVSLSPPTSDPAPGRLGNGDVIPLARSGRNPEVEEVLGALSLLLNGGGVAQLKTIATELNKALDGREGDARSVLTRVDVLMKQLDANKDTIVAAIESLNRLAIALNKQKPAITAALDQLPRAVASINSQRDDLVKMLKALSDLSAVGTRVIAQSKAGTVDSLKALVPTLTKLNEAGDALPKALQVFLTYPFVDAVVGKNAAQARNLHMGDYTNLSVQLDLDLSNGLPGLPSLGGLCQAVPADPVPGLNLPDAPCDQLDSLQRCAQGLLDAGTDPSSLADAVKACGSRLPTVCRSVTAGTQLAQICSLTDHLPTGLRLPNLPKVPKPPSLSQLQKCLASGKPLGAACDKIDPRVIAKRCAPKGSPAKPKGYGSATCKQYRKLKLGVLQSGELGPLPVVGGGGSGGDGGVLGGVGGGLLGGANRAGVGPAARPSTKTVATTGVRSDLGALLVWGMVQR